MNSLKITHRIGSLNLFRLVLGLLLSSFGASAQTNYWLKSASGSWEEQFWSLGVMPSPDHNVVFNSPGNKVLAISQETAQQHPQSLTVNTLEVGAPDTSRNMLVLDDLGLNSPLVVNDWFTLGSNAALYCLHSSLKIGTAASGGFVVGGQVFQGEGAQVDVHALWLGYCGEAAYYLSNGLFSVGALHLGGNDFPALFHQEGGKSQAVEFNLYAGSHVVIQDGTFTSSRLVVGLGDTAFRQLNYEPVLTQSGGTVSVQDELVLGLGHHGSGVYSLRAGSLTSQALLVGAKRDAAGTFEQSGGTNQTVRLVISEEADDPMTIPDSYGHSGYFLSGGYLFTSESVVGNGREGIFKQSGGEHRVEGDLLVQGMTTRSSYYLIAGRLSARSLQVTKANFSQAEGTNAVLDLKVGINQQDRASYNLSGGQLTASTIDVAGVGTGFTQTGGRQQVNQQLSVQGRYDFLGGELQVQDLYLAGNFVQSGGTLSCQGVVNMAGGTLNTLAGHRQLGALCLSKSSRIVFGSEACDQDWSASRKLHWVSGAQLVVEQWQGSLTGGGRHQLCFGKNPSGLAPQQVAQIIFRSPFGLPAGDYPARLLPNGEVVPQAAAWAPGALAKR